MTFQLLGCLCLASMFLNFALLYMLRASMRDIREVATEALLASKAQSAEDFASAQIQVHAATQEREVAPTSKPAAGVVNMDNNIPQIRGHDGRILEALRPM